MKKKILIFGGGGFVGGNLATIAHRQGWEVYIADRAIKPGLNFAKWKSVDVTDLPAVRRVIQETAPDAVVNLAAMAAIDKAERERELAWAINVTGAKNVAECCAAEGIRNIYFSSDAVFDGEASSYTEESPLAPVNYYGQTKAEGERAVLAADPKSVVIRISLVLGYPVTGGNAFFAGLAAKLKTGNEILAPKEEVRTPVDVITLSACVLELTENDFSGIIHLGSTSFIDRYSLARKIVQQMGHAPDCVILPNSQEIQTERAARHRNGIIEVTKAEALLTTKLLGADESIQRAFDDRIPSVEA